MSLVLVGIDLETTGLDPKLHHITEIGISRWEFGHTEARFIDTTSFLLQLPEGVTVPQEITELTGIDNALLKDYGMPREMAMAALAGFMNQADFMVAHRRSFEEGFIFHELERSRTELRAMFLERCWIDTKADIQWRDRIQVGTSLVHLGADHGMLNQRPHRAGADAEFMMGILAQYDIKPVIQRLSEPHTEISAPGLPFMRKQEAKDLAYNWDAERKLWVKIILASELEQEKALAKFDVRVEKNLPCRVPKQQKLL